MIITTTDNIDGRNIIRYFDPVTKSVVLGSNVIADFGAGLTDFFGGRSNNYESRLQLINESALDMLKKHAKRLKANAIVGVKIDVGEISGGGKNMFMVTVVGTPVILDVKQNHSTEKVIDHQSINTKIKVKRLMASSDNIYQLTNEQLLYAVESGIPEFIPHIEQSLDIENPTLKNAFDLESLIGKLKNSLLIFDRLPVDIAKDNLYSWLLQDIHFRVKSTISNTIIELELVDYEKSLKLLDSKDVINKKHALKILNTDKNIYSENDLKALKKLQDSNLLHFFPNSEIFETKGIFGTKRIWKCTCGATNSEIDLRCACGRDLQGFRLDEITPCHVQEIINEKINLLELNSPK